MKFESITLFTSELDETLQFYEEILECPVTVINQDAFIVKIGETQLQFRKSDEVAQPYYHFAIDIPYNHFYKMKEHYQNILFLLMEDGQHTAYFESFVAHALYFNDPSGNIVELIARVSNITDEPEFTRISEIGFVCNETNAIYQALSDYKIATFEHAHFEPCALNFLGDANDESYILLIPEDRRWLFSDKHSIAYPIEIKTQKFHLSYDVQHRWHVSPA
ncbi:hypothetical protein [Staphylococcus edaphicus]|uniref:Toxoflavin-degrading enzyme domain-containing protein n=1 Tax=Staphylococcus edaphicus TaxID=1955013 RepID=A0A2C6WLI3_9STAP|nr:hypothetical protein [Staphylococcus edaphicus]PHK49960.1 hypothetical protein BTJ66_05495 [Staphylococcus edaphicus]UQW81779.1 hypothetical protein MNY58_01300 [Staphylococcus edaphicus]